MADTIFHVFLPHHFLYQNSPHQLYACYALSDNYVLINCVFAFPEDSIHEDLPDETLDKDKLKCSFGRIGCLYFNDDLPPLKNLINDEMREVWLTVNVQRGEGEIVLDRTFCNGKRVAPENIYLMIYKGNAVKNSKFLYREAIDNTNTVLAGSFVQFLSESVDFSIQKHASLENSPTVLSPMRKPRISRLKNFSIFPYFAKFFGFLIMLFAWWPTKLETWLINSTLIRQFYRRAYQIQSAYLEFKGKNNLTFRSKNIILAIFLDIIFGCFAVYNIHSEVPYQVLLDQVLDLMSEFVNWLEQLINWLMGAPAGLKLNIPLNSIMGHFFLYHVYLWRTYIITVLPIFEIAIRFVRIIGIFGYTFILCLISDIGSLMATHIYLFYGYASRVYYYQLKSLVNLWRVFRGKKWNPETNKLESHSYAAHQLYIGTLLFTVLLFLLPTVMVYYCVFTALRIAVLVVQGILLRLIKVLSLVPVYAILLRLCYSEQTTGCLNFSVLKSDSVLILSMELMQVGLQDLIQFSMPYWKEWEVQPRWRTLVSSLVWGQIIYPI